MSTLFDLLPTVHRIRDAQRSGQLEALVDLMSEQVDLLGADLDGLWDDLFIETCAEWVVPYIGDLVANTPLYEVPGVGRRADVADTIRWRRRKGTLTMLGALARHVTGWSATAVATFELLGWNQNLEHLRMLADASDPGHRHPLAMDRVGTVDLRDRDLVDRVDSAFDQVTHTVDVRSIADDEGWYGIRKVCFFLFRLQAFPMVAMTPAQSTSGSAGCLHVHPLGQDAPVFHAGTTVDDDELATEDNVDAPIRPYHFYLHPESDWNQTLAIRHGPGGTRVAVTDVLCKDLSTWPAVPDDKVAVDVRTGRLRIGSNVALADPVTVDAAYGFSAPMGGGPYPRAAATSAPRPGELVLQVSRSGAGTSYASIANALTHWATLPASDVRIVIVDSATYNLPAAGLQVQRGWRRPSGSRSSPPTASARCWSATSPSTTSRSPRSRSTASSWPARSTSGERSRRCR